MLIIVGNIRDLSKCLNILMLSCSKLFLNLCPNTLNRLLTLLFPLLAAFFLLMESPVYAALRCDYTIKIIFDKLSIF